MLELVNKTLYQRPIEGQYIAVTYAIFDPQAKTIALANSGLPYPLLVRAGQPTFLDIGGIPLGLFPDSQYEETTIQLRAGDVLVFYSDGVVEMRNDFGDEFGMRRLSETVRSNHQKSPEEIVKAITAALADFIGRVRPQDDRTTVVLKMGEDGEIPHNFPNTPSISS
jgi:sigma-B regulation protein RsbU (phosphoserine phosphatase)